MSKSYHKSWLLPLPCPCVAEYTEDETYPEYSGISQVMCYDNVPMWYMKIACFASLAFRAPMNFISGASYVNGFVWLGDEIYPDDE